MKREGKKDTQKGRERNTQKGKERDIKGGRERKKEIIILFFYDWKKKINKTFSQFILTQKTKIER